MPPMPQQRLPGATYPCLELPQYLQVGAAAGHDAIFSTAGALHITNTSIVSAQELAALLPALGFGPTEQFSTGGRTAADWQEKWAARGLRRMDYYPPHLPLLPNTEIQYQRHYPARVLLFCSRAADTGGEVSLHAAKDVEQYLTAAGSHGRDFLKKAQDHGFMIETGFLDAHDPEKKNNYFQSWQERFGTDDMDCAISLARANTTEYDACWWHDNDGFPVLMTRICSPGFVTHPDNGESYLRFPRIAMDGPQPRNGFRRFPFGDGSNLTPDEITLVRAAYAATPRSHGWAQGDILIFDNIRFGHSRTPFSGAREILVGMAGHRQLPPATPGAPE